MSRKISVVLLATAAAGTLILISLGIVMHRYPYTVRYVISKLVPSVQVNYQGADIDFLNTFNDKQDRQIKAARKVGLKKIPSSRADIDGMLDQLEEVKSCRTYSLAPMSHSVPYLRPNAKAALEQIGTAFRDSLKSKGLPEYKIVVTSILRTKADVERLRKTNSLATSNSCHCYGTTFDISYAQFERISVGKHMSAGDLKKVLGEVLRDQRKNGNIYVKYEVGQHCFHITSRKLL